MEQARRNIDAYKLLLPKPLRGRSIALWGHGADYAGSRSKADSLLRTALTRRAEWFFGYTAAGVASVHQQGLPAGLSTEVRNSTDTKQLKLDIQESLGSSLSEFQQGLGLGQFTAAYLGALDEGKRLDLLIAAGHEVWKAIPSFKLLVAGDGPERELVEGADARYPWLSYLGPVAGKAKAHVLAASSVLMVPGSIGLVAVDALAAGVPIITTSKNSHGPEFDYLVHGQTSIVTPPIVEEYAQAVIALHSHPTDLLRMRENCRAVGSEFSIEDMAENFLTGILAFIDAKFGI
jgi:glycosyltransferase involved in cell wall biosynthesis